MQVSLPFQGTLEIQDVAWPLKWNDADTIIIDKVGINLNRVSVPGIKDYCDD